MDVCVGSTNPTKLKGTKEAFDMFFKDVNIRGYNIQTNLPPQPIGLELIMEGARRRAIASLDIGEGCDFGVGIEAGFIPIENVYFDVQVAFVIDKNGKGFYGFSPIFIIPRMFVEKIFSGEYKELEEIVDDYFHTRNIGEKGGFVSLLTRGRVRREHLVFYAVAMALIPFINQDLYF